MRTAKIITDPIYEVMNFGSDPAFIRTFKQVIDTKVFQRLRRITQLGLASYVFPGATHTRFSHSLGAAYLARTLFRVDRSRSQASGLSIVQSIMSHTRHALSFPQGY